MAAGPPQTVTPSGHGRHVAATGASRDLGWAPDLTLLVLWAKDGRAASDHITSRPTLPAAPVSSCGDLGCMNCSAIVYNVFMYSVIVHSAPIYNGYICSAHLYIVV